VVKIAQPHGGDGIEQDDLHLRLLTVVPTSPRVPHQHDVLLP
jgi:hypothetical protein